MSSNSIPPLLLSPLPAARITLAYRDNPGVYSLGLIILNTVSVSGGIITNYSLLSGTLPASLTLNAATGEISGALTEFSDSSVVILGTGPAGSATVLLHIVVPTPPTNLTYSFNPATYLINTTIAANLPTVSSGLVNSYAVTAGDLPAGLFLSPSSGLITGTPTAAGTTTFTVTAYGVNGLPGTCSVTITILHPVTLAYPASPIMVEQTYVFMLMPAVSGTPTSFMITSGSVPADVTFLPAGGAFRGFVWQASFTVTVLASNGVSNASATITVQPSYQPITLQYPETNDGSPMTLLVENTYSLKPLVSGGGAPYGLAYALSAGALPLGMTLDTTPGSATLGTISGTLDASGVGQTYTATIQVTGHQGPTGAAQSQAPWSRSPSPPLAPRLTCQSSTRPRASTTTPPPALRGFCCRCSSTRATQSRYSP